MKKTLLFASAVAVITSISGAQAATDFLAGDVDAGKAKSAACAGCHGADGNAPAPSFPKLAGLGAAYITNQLMAFKSGDRKNGIMQGQAANLSEADMHNLGAYFSAQGVKIGEASEQGKEEGAPVYRGGDQKTGLPACMACHGAAGAGNPAAGYPALSGQYAGYVEAQLKAFAAGERKNAIMEPIANAMTPAQMKAVAQYVQGLY